LSTLGPVTGLFKSKVPFQLAKRGKFWTRRVMAKGGGALSLLVGSSREGSTSLLQRRPNKKF